MIKLAICIFVSTMMIGCLSAITGNPPLTGRSIAVADLPDVVRTSARQAFPNSYIIRASAIEVAPYPPSYLVRIRNVKGESALLEISNTGHIGKEITEQAESTVPVKAAPSVPSPVR